VKHVVIKILVLFILSSSVIADSAYEEILKKYDLHMFTRSRSSWIRLLSRGSYISRHGINKNDAKFIISVLKKGEK